MGLDSVEFVMEVEDEFDLKIPDADAEQMQTVGDTVRYVAAQHGLDLDTSKSNPDEMKKIEAVRERVYTIVAEQFGVKRDSITDETHYVDDLNAD